MSNFVLVWFSLSWLLWPSAQKEAGGGVFLSLGISSAIAQEGNVPELLVVPWWTRSVAESGEAKNVPQFERLPVVFGSQFADGVTAPSTGPIRYLDLRGKPLEPGSRLPKGGVHLWPVAPGRAALRLKDGLRLVFVLQVQVRSEVDGRPVPRSRVALSRSLPPELALSEDSQKADEEAVEFAFAGPLQALPSTVEVISRDSGGSYVDALARVPLLSAPCPSSPDPEIACGVTPRLRLSVDEVERSHVALSERTLMGQVGGTLLLRHKDKKLLEVPVGAPEALEEDGPGRYRVRLRTRILRTYADGPPAVGADDDEARSIAAQEIASASKLWGQCGITMGPEEGWDIQVVPPPELSLLTVGCRGGFPASGGHIDLKVAGRRVLLRTKRGETPESIASRLQAALLSAGFRVSLHANPLVRSVALSSFDLLIRSGNQSPVSVTAWGSPDAPLSSDPSLGVCESAVDLADGLQHFTDFDASSGTAEERALLRGLMDDDPQTIDLLIVPVFSGVGRIGESFIFSPGVSLQNALILDRTGIRAGARSFTLAHELGHVLLALPGHPDDYGVDTPHSLMDADAADSTVFGPRRLSLEECRRALRQSGRDAPVPLLIDWPLSR